MAKKRLSRRARRQVETENEYIFTRKMNMKRIDPMTKTQSKLISLYNQGGNLAAIGTAGTGKTYLSTYLAMQDVLDEKQEGILFIRSTVQSRDQGFMPGNKQEKESHFEEPFIDIINDLFGRKDAYSLMKQRGTIDFRSTSFARGLTIDNKIIILDEVQNCTYEEIRTIVTRVGENSRLIMCGDTKQDDLKISRNRRDVSGLFQMIKVLEEVEDFGIVNFTKDDIVRSKFVKDFIIAEERILEEV